MNKKILFYDPYKHWAKACIETANRRGWQARLINSPDETPSDGFVMMRVHPKTILKEREMGRRLSQNPNIKLIVDQAQLDVWNNKREQVYRWSQYMPPSYIFGTLDEAMSFINTYDGPYPLVSKADEGASSVNIRILNNKQDTEKHIREIFTKGLRVICGQGVNSVQNDYVLLQEFIPHTITYRINIVGNQNAIFHRFCYPNKPVAQTGNVKPVGVLNDEMVDLLHWSDNVFKTLDTHWCAIDVLKSASGWRLLETSIGWPWPSPGDCDEVGRFFKFDGSTWQTGHQWKGMWDVLVDELEVGVWGAT